MDKSGPKDIPASRRDSIDSDDGASRSSFDSSRSFDKAEGNKFWQERKKWQDKRFASSLPADFKDAYSGWYSA